MQYKWLADVYCRNTECPENGQKKQVYLYEPVENEIIDCYGCAVKITDITLIERFEVSDA